MATIDDIEAAVGTYYAGVAGVTPADSTIKLSVLSAIDAINEIREYTNSEDTTDVLEDKYSTKAIRIAIYLCDKEGIFGIQNFSENGLSRSYENCDIPTAFLSGITPICRAY